VGKRTGIVNTARKKVLLLVDISPWQEISLLVPSTFFEGNGVILHGEYQWSR
jgi:hypothetical protein